MAHNKCYAYLNASFPIGYCKYLKLDRACIANNMEYSNHPLFAIVEVLMDIDISTANTFQNSIYPFFEVAAHFLHEI